MSVLNFSFYRILDFHSIDSNPLDFNYKLKNGVLGDVAPTILDWMGINKPKEMTGKSLINQI